MNSDQLYCCKCKMYVDTDVEPRMSDGKEVAYQYRCTICRSII